MSLRVLTCSQGFISALYSTIGKCLSSSRDNAVESSHDCAVDKHTL
jgi:hypothetical protein